MLLRKKGMFFNGYFGMPQREIVAYRGVYDIFICDAYIKILFVIANKFHEILSFLNTFIMGLNSLHNI